MSALSKFVRQFNFTQMTTPAILRIGQNVARNVGTPEIAAAGRWGIALGLVVYWMIEPNFENSSSSSSS